VAWLERQAEVAEDLVARRKLAEEPTRVVTMGGRMEAPQSPIKG
jgi:hypothetical protein